MSIKKTAGEGIVPPPSTVSESARSLSALIERWRDNGREVGNGTLLNCARDLEELLSAAPSPAGEAAPQTELLICSAVRMPDGYIVRGHRHHDCFRTMDGIPRYKDVKVGPHDQGFMTSRNRFVGRDEALTLFLAAGGELKCGGNTLTSEELW